MKVKGKNSTDLVNEKTINDEFYVTSFPQNSTYYARCFRVPTMLKAMLA